jgi:hypothetical protein
MSRATEPIFNPADFNARLMFGVVVFARRRVGVVLVDRDFLAGAMMTGQLLFQIKGSGPIFMAHRGFWLRIFAKIQSSGKLEVRILSLRYSSSRRP